MTVRYCYIFKRAIFVLLLIPFMFMFLKGNSISVDTHEKFHNTLFAYQKSIETTFSFTFSKHKGLSNIDSYSEKHVASSNSKKVIVDDDIEQELDITAENELQKKVVLKGTDTISDIETKIEPKNSDGQNVVEVKVKGQKKDGNQDKEIQDLRENPSATSNSQRKSEKSEENKKNTHISQRNKDVVSKKPSVPKTDGSPSKTTEQTMKPKESPSKSSAKETVDIPEFNKIVLDIIETYSGGSYPYLLNEDYSNYNGVTTNLYYQDRLLLKAHPSGNKANHCVGITFEVFYRSMKKWNELSGLSKDNIGGLTFEELFDFVLTWYVAKGPKEVSNLAIAMQNYGLGIRITDLMDVKPGDFIDLSRTNNTGHAVVFIGWIKEGNNIIGLKYWSTQPATGGTGYRKEYFFGYYNGRVLKDKLYIGRATPKK